MSASFSQKLNQAWDRLQQGDAAGAQFLCRDILRDDPRNPEALYLLGAVQLMNNLPQDALRTLEQARAAAPDDGPILESLGVTYLMLGNFAAAEAPLRTAAGLAGAPPSVYMRLGLALMNQSRHDEALAELKRAALLDSGHPDIQLNLGMAYARSGAHAAARTAFEAALQQAPGHPQASYNLAALCMDERRYDEARRWFEQALPGAMAGAADAATVTEIREGLAVANAALGRNPEAITHLRAILETTAPTAGVLTRLAQALFQTAKLDEAADAARRAIALDPLETEAHATLSDVLLTRGDLAGGAAALAEGVTRTGSIRLLGMLRFEYRRQCDWPRWREAWAQLRPALAADAAAAAPNPDAALSPFSLLCEDTTPAQQRLIAERFTAAQFPTAAAAPARPARNTGDNRLRIGYLSSDLHEHAVGYLIAEVLETHDRTQFEVTAYSFGPEDGSAQRTRLKTACEHFVDLAWDPDDIAAQRLADDGLDILVDLKGYTLGARPGLLARRPCAIQINWLGYPGTMGAPFMDYLIADPVLIPPGEEDSCSERVLRLPHCYQPNDRRRVIPAPRTRKAYGLPDAGAGVVFCCFNQAYKLTPDVFACWLRLLKGSPGSVLWLLEDHPLTMQNLRAAAAAQGVDGARLVFGPKLPLHEHLARYRTADLALDTFPYTSHTTASDALWAGCPLVALTGSTFASRVSGSILTAGGLPELITGSLPAYEALAAALAADPARRAALRAQLDRARDTTPLFDTAAFTRALEELYGEISSR